MSIGERLSKLPKALHLDNESGDTPEHRLYLEVLVRALLDIREAHNSMYRKTAVKWVCGLTKDPPISFAKCIEILNLDDSLATQIQKEAEHG